MKNLNNRRSDGQKVGRSATATSCRSGFTLVELVIVIAIVIILSVVSVPIYRGYTRNAKMSEGYALLGMIISSQKAYFSQYGNFLLNIHSSAKKNYWTCNDEVLGINAKGNKYFTCFSVSGPDTSYGGGSSLSNRIFAYAIIPSDICIDNKNLLRFGYKSDSGLSNYSELTESGFVN